MKSSDFWTILVHLPQIKRRLAGVVSRDDVTVKLKSGQGLIINTECVLVELLPNLIFAIVQQWCIVIKSILQVLFGNNSAEQF
jgi:hypothetical protein